MLSSLLIRHRPRAATPILLAARQLASSNPPPSVGPSPYLDPLTSLPLPPSLLPPLPLPPRHPTPERIGRDSKVPVRPDHPLWAFFRKDASVESGVLTIERIKKTDSVVRSGRPFTAAELRLKSFDELHTLWHLLLREKNIYYTQLAEAARRGVHERERKKLGTGIQRAKVQLSMARIKFVLSERATAYRAVASDAASLAQLQDRAKYVEALRPEPFSSSEEGAETEAGGVGEGDEELDPDVLAGRRLPEPPQVKAFRAKLLAEAGRDPRGSNGRLAGRGEGERRRLEEELGGKREGWKISKKKKGGRGKTEKEARVGEA